MKLIPHRSTENVTRREFLWRSGGGLGGVALAQKLADQKLLAADSPIVPPHFAPRAKFVIQLFMNGGASQMDTFDYKPELIKRNGQKFDPGEHVEAPTDRKSIRLNSSHGYIS